MDSKSWSAMGRCGRSFVFLGRQYATLEIQGGVLGRHVGHESCCCFAVLQPARKAGICLGGCITSHTIVWLGKVFRLVSRVCIVFALRDA